jgi:hypothetical protein
MSLTKIDCKIISGTTGVGALPLYAVFNPARQPGSLVVAATVAQGSALSAQVAARLTMERMIEALLQQAETSNALVDHRIESEESHAPEVREDKAAAEISAAFRSANNSVHEFSQKLGSSGRMAAATIALFVRESVIAAGRAGGLDVILVRASKVHRLFHPASESEPTYGFVGQNAALSIELASLPLHAHDTVLVFPFELTDPECAWLEEGGCTLPQLESTIRTRIARVHHEMPFVIVASIGPEAIYLGSDTRHCVPVVRRARGE